MKFQFLIFLICLFHLSSHAQEGAYFLQKHINGESGLPQNTVRDLMFSPAGFLWIATENGLVRYDGKSIRTYTVSNSELPKNRISQLLPMKNGRMYCVAEGENLSEIIETKNKIQLKFIKRIRHVGFSSYHLFSADSLPTFEKICNKILPENVTQAEKFSFFILNKKNKVVQLGRNKLVIYDSNIKEEKSIPFQDINANNFFINNDELYFTSSQLKVSHFNIETNKITSCKGKLIPSIKQDVNQTTLNNSKFIWDYKSNRSFYISNNSLFEISLQHDSLESDLLLTNLPPYKINSIAFSSNKNTLIIGTINNGIFCYGRKKFNILVSPFSFNAFYAQAYSSRDKRILTSMPFLQFDLEGKSTILNDSIVNNLTFYANENQELFYASASNIFKYNLKTRKTSRVVSLPLAKYTGLGFIAKKDTSSLYISSNNAFYSYNEKNGLHYIGDFNSNNNIQRAYALEYINDSLIYIATDTGIYKFNKINEKLELLCLPNENVRTIYKTRSGLVLAGTYDKGYYVIQDKNAIPIPLDKNENLKSTHCFIEDKLGFIWMSSNNGLFKVALNEIQNYLKHKNNNILYYYRYSHEDGLLTNEFNGGCYPSALKIDSSIWSLPSMQGLVVFSPEKLNNYFDSSPIFLDKIILNDSVLNEENVSVIHTLKHEFKLSFFITSPNWSDDNNLYIEYALDPTSTKSEWTLLKDNNSPIIIQNLSGGYHKIIIRKKTGIDQFDYSTTELNIHVPKLINEYWWFWPLVALIILTTIYGSAKLATYVISRQKLLLEKMVNQKTFQLQEAVNVLEEQNITIKKSEEILSKENELKSTLLFLLSHDIASPLRFINLFLSGVAHSNEVVNMSKEDLVDLTISTQNLEALLDNIVAWIKQTLNAVNEIETENVDINLLLNEKIKLFQLAIKKKNNTVINELPVDLNLQTNKFIVSMALQNIIGNAINYTKAGNIRITYQHSVSGDEISVIDSGNNLKRKQNNEHDVLVGYGIGLKITNELLKLIDGEIKLEPLKNNEGMKATIYLRKK